jgi:fructokinase
MAGLLSKLVDNDFGLLHHEGKLRDALQFANGCGAITTTERGAIPALPDTETVLRLMSKESM